MPDYDFKSLTFEIIPLFGIEKNLMLLIDINVIIPQIPVDVVLVYLEALSPEF